MDVKTLTSDEVKEIVLEWLTSGGEKGARWIPSLVETIEKTRARVTALEVAWGESWYCSADPGHRIMNAAIREV